jgi:hypothetical protein
VKSNGDDTWLVSPISSWLFAVVPRFSPVAVLSDSTVPSRSRIMVRMEPWPALAPTAHRYSTSTNVPEGML